jgi:hypothetical protein
MSKLLPGSSVYEITSARSKATTGVGVLEGVGVLLGSGLGLGLGVTVSVGTGDEVSLGSAVAEGGSGLAVSAGWSVSVAVQAATSKVIIIKSVSTIHFVFINASQWLRH